MDIDFKVTFEAINMLKTSHTKQQLLLLLNLKPKNLCPNLGRGD